MNTRGVLLACLIVGWMALTVGHAQQPTGEPSVPVVEVPGAVKQVAPGQPSQPAVTVTTVPSPAAPAHAPEQIMWALAASYILRYLTKKSWFPFLNPTSTARVKTLWGLGAAILTSQGIHFVANGSFWGDGATYTVTGLSFSALKDVVFQWASQQAWFDGLVRQKETV